MPKVTHLNSSLGKESSEKKTRKEFETKVNSVSNSDDDLVLHCGLEENKSSDPYSLFKKIISRLRCSSTFIKNNKRIRLIGNLSAISLFILAFLFIFPVVIKSDTAEGTAGVEEVPTLTMVIGKESANLDLVVRSSNGTFATTDSASSVAFSVKTNNYTGYTLNVRGSSTDDAKNNVLTNSNTGDTLSSITSAVDADTFASSDTTLNKWGYLPSKLNSIANTNYQPAPTKTDTLLDKTNTANTTANNYTIGLGAKVDYTVPSGLYTNTYTLEAVANYVAYAINYYDGLNATSIGAQSSEINTAATITLAPTYKSGSAPTRATYTFKSWCLGTVNSATTYNTSTKTYYNPATVCTGTEYINGASMPIDPTVDNTDIKLYAVWNPTTFDTAYARNSKSKDTTGYYKMQDMTSTICNAVTVNQTTTLTDVRINGSYNSRTNYTIIKLEDGRCWMADNLDLDVYTARNSFTTTNTHITDSTALTRFKNGGGTTSDRYPTAAIVAGWTNNPNSSYSAPLQNRGGSCNSTSTAQCASPYQGASYTNTTVVNKVATGWNSAGEATASLVVNIGPGKYQLGTYYNYCAVSLGYYCWGDSSSSGSHTEAAGYNINNDICPYGWRMPTGGASGEYQNLITVVKNNYPTTYGAITSPYSVYSMLSLVFSGNYHSNTAYLVGKAGHLWTSTYNATSNMFVFRFYHSTLDPKDTPGRSLGNTVRCIAQN